MTKRVGEREGGEQGREEECGRSDQRVQKCHSILYLSRTILHMLYSTAPHYTIQDLPSINIINFLPAGGPYNVPRKREKGNEEIIRFYYHKAGSLFEGIN